ncbi:uncharacterized protein LOC128555138 isoform X2 [Mercenaria mercenaria]|uniref:uncharacterized protein LOC128555138 isoform X2 n=1 Tax=Mercenaria mercenaria TaxID=6596 RepID=UPI00234F7FD7|nr:uncharacterized protein LOC128555138 isoform X2 [Mercenaria mercenaria]
METDGTSNRSDRLSAEEETLCQHLEQIFPNHEQLVIRQTVLTVSKLTNPIEGRLERCIEELVNISPAGHKKSMSMQKDGEVLSPIQSDVISDLKQIFPNYNVKLIKKAVCHPGNLFEPLAKPTLLQRCIDDLLDRRTALEADTDADLDYEDIFEDDNNVGTGLDLENTTPRIAVLTEGNHNTFNEDELPSAVQSNGDLINSTVSVP